MPASLGDVLRPKSPAVKRYLGGTHRYRDPVETLRVISPHFAAVGLTRIADVTGLDRIGIPVCMAVRPNSRSLSVAQGKGLTLPLAKVSAAMESIETHHAEYVSLPTRTASYRELSKTASVCDPATLSLHPMSIYHDDLPLDWINGFDLLQGHEVFIPYDLVHCCYLADSNRRPVFTMSSNGLASGNHLLEAVSHAICEVVERDAASLWEWRTLDPQADGGLVDLATVNSPACQKLFDSLAGAGVSAYVWDQTSDVGIPTFACAIIEHKPERFPHALGPYPGFGCHLSKDVALIRAITEAAQSRLTHISGARDDMFRSSYLMIASEQGTAELTKRILESRPTVDYSALPSPATDTLDEDVSAELSLLTRAGFERAIMVDLTDPTIGIPVVRMVIPGMEFRTKHDPLPRGLRSRTRQRLVTQQLTRMILQEQK